jgi:hypothetical protein
MIKITTGNQLKSQPLTPEKSGKDFLKCAE